MRQCTINTNSWPLRLKPSFKFSPIKSKNIIISSNTKNYYLMKINNDYYSIYEKKAMTLLKEKKTNKVSKSNLLHQKPKAGKTTINLNTN